MIISLNIKLVDGMYFEEDWKCEIELDEEATMEDLHLAIQDAAGFGNDHPYDFFVARGPRSSRGERFPCDDSSHPIATCLKELYPLQNSNRLFYRFDFGDQWAFQISKSRKKPKEPEPGKKHPRMVSEEGVKPIQYPSVEY